MAKVIILLVYYLLEQLAYVFCICILGVPWTEEEHRLFLIGLQKLGKGDWRGIARNFVVSRTPTQVASHAQKFFIRQSNATRRKRRSSLFDMVPEMVCLTSFIFIFHLYNHTGIYVDRLIFACQWYLV
jgi:SHAQKYF class myb-like DNA-binding protein